MPNINTLDDRKIIVQNIMLSLNDLNLTPQNYSPVAQLFQLFNTYINEGKEIKVNIYIRELNKRIVGKLPIYKGDKPWLNLEKI